MIPYIVGTVYLCRVKAAVLLRPVVVVVNVVNVVSSSWLLVVGKGREGGKGFRSLVLSPSCGVTLINSLENPCNSSTTYSSSSYMLGLGYCLPRKWLMRNGKHTFCYRITGEALVAATMACDDGGGGGGGSGTREQGNDDI
ncbi:hypothetical protein M0804_006992 [Polistes exclamans]|nr:hypothetical protein M0804_006992 [Polistes exclamans]